MERKPNQNTVVYEDVYETSGKMKIPVRLKVVTTFSQVFVHKGNEIIAVAAVKNPKDFDYDALFKIAMAKTKLATEM